LSRLPSDASTPPNSVFDEEDSLHPPISESPSPEIPHHNLGGGEPSSGISGRQSKDPHTPVTPKRPRGPGTSKPQSKQATPKPSSTDPTPRRARASKATKTTETVTPVSEREASRVAYLARHDLAVEIPPLSTRRKPASRLGRNSRRSASPVSERARKSYRDRTDPSGGAAGPSNTRPPSRMFPLPPSSNVSKGKGKAPVSS
jgi:hypothetical protein